jgi:hypothetical protein
MYREGENHESTHRCRFDFGDLLAEAASLGAALDLVLAIVASPSSRVGACMNG